MENQENQLVTKMFNGQPVTLTVKEMKEKEFEQKWANSKSMIQEEIDKKCEEVTNRFKQAAKEYLEEQAKMEKNLKGRLTDFITKESYEKLMYKKCRNCGEEISSKLYFERRTCPHCGECCSKAEMKDIHVFFELSPPSDIGVDFLRYYRDELRKPYDRKIDYNIYQFAQEFDIPKNSLHFWSKNYCNERASSMICDIFKDKGKNTKIYLWCNAKNANSMLNLLYYSERFENCNNVYYVKYATKQDLKNKNYKLTDSIVNAVKLKKSDFKNLKKEYKEITKKDGYFLSKDDKVVYYNEDFFNETLLSLITTRYKTGSSLLFNFRKLIKNYGVIYYTQFCSILDNLCKKNLVDSKKYYDIYMNLPEHEFKLVKQHKSKINYLDALEYISLAIEDCSTYALYRILKDDALFHSLDTDTKIEGKENIINYLENVNLRKLESEYITPCRAYKLKNENIKYYEDVRMYIHYSISDTYSEVKVQYNDGIIEKILILENTYLDDNYETYNPFKLELKQKFKNSFKTLTEQQLMKLEDEENDDFELKFSNKTIDEKEVLLVEYLSKEERQEYEMLKSQIDDDKTGEIAYKLSHLLRTAARYQMEKDRPDEPLCQWDMWFQDGPAMKYMEISKDLGYLMGQFEWLEHNEKHRTWEEVFDDYKKLALEHNFALAARRLSTLYKAEHHFNMRTICPRRDLKRALYWFDKSLELAGKEKEESLYREELVKEIKKEESETKEDVSADKKIDVENIKNLVECFMKEDDCFKAVVRSCVLNGSISMAQLQRIHRLNYSRLGRILDNIEMCGFISFSLKPKVFLTLDEYEIIFEECIDN